MRMRKKKNLIPRMERCSAYHITNPSELRGKWRSLFPEAKELRLELGCGKGRFTVESAKNEPDVLFIAVEKVADAMVIAMERAAALSLTNLFFIDADVVHLPDFFAPEEVDRIYLNFSDPWPSNRHIRRRLTSGGFLQLYRQILAEGASIHFKTDNVGLFTFSVEEFPQYGFVLSEVTDDLHGEGICGVMTDYEAKFHEQGIPIHRCVATMVPWTAPVAESKTAREDFAPMVYQKRRIGIIGAGHVGSHAGFTLIAQGLAEEIVFLDTDKDKAIAQALDLSDATTYLPHRVKVWAGDYADMRDAQLIVVSAGPLPDMGKGQTRMDTLKQTIDIVKDIVTGIQNSGFAGIILNISNPADVVTHYLQHQLNWNPQRIFSTSTTLDSARLRRALATEIGIDQKSICAYALGEHGESQMVPWSMVTIGGKSLMQLREEYPETYGKLDLHAIAEAGKVAGWTILGGKGCTEFGIGVSIAEVVRAVFGDENRILPVSTLLQGQYGVQDVYASVPAVLNCNGVAQVIELPMTDEELEQFHNSCRTMDENYRLALSM